MPRANPVQPRIAIRSSTREDARDPGRLILSLIEPTHLIDFNQACVPITGRAQTFEIS